MTELRSPHTRDTAELVLGVLRVAEGRVVFCRPRRGPAVDLVDWIGDRRPIGGLNADRGRLANSTKAATEARRAQAVSVSRAAAV